MATISSFMLCESSQKLPNGQGGIVQQLIGPVTTLRPQYIPGNYSFSSSVGVIGLDMQKDNSMRFVLKAPSGDMLNDLGEAPLPVAAPDNVLPKEYGGFVACIDFRNVVIPEPGVYSLEVHINGELIGTKDIPIYGRSVTV